jgi:hypothetical protein
MHPRKRQARPVPASAVPAALAPTLIIIGTLAVSMFVTHAEVVILIGTAVALAVFYLLRRAALLRPPPDVDPASRRHGVAPAHAVGAPDRGPQAGRMRAKVAGPVQERGR